MYLKLALFAFLNLFFLKLSQEMFVALTSPDDVVLPFLNVPFSIAAFCYLLCLIPLWRNASLVRCIICLLTAGIVFCLVWSWGIVYITNYVSSLPQGKNTLLYTNTSGWQFTEFGWTAIGYCLIVLLPPFLLNLFVCLLGRKWFFRVVA
ncbi:hypothetical protein NOS3756_23920 [Nostoc sp. NIES-3756]|uniref:hypothetical protein n=1 Tax=Nostoc sp. NIES-3756 TaxID=1751286 RepID=UPI00071F5FC3|nr:hypothetical protein [Nostoc sp. NIES-3756]BAT53432.1 hypothetical protein NOS3756_23920 [Nostoc sp. NIES-3756]